MGLLNLGLPDYVDDLNEIPKISARRKLVSLQSRRHLMTQAKVREMRLHTREKEIEEARDRFHLWSFQKP